MFLRRFYESSNERERERLVFMQILPLSAPPPHKIKPLIIELRVVACRRQRHIAAPNRHNYARIRYDGGHVEVSAGGFPRRRPSPPSFAAAALAGKYASPHRLFMQSDTGGEKRGGGARGTSFPFGYRASRPSRGKQKNFPGYVFRCACTPRAVRHARYIP